MMNDHELRKKIHEAIQTGSYPPEHDSDGGYDPSMMEDALLALIHEQCQA